MQIRNNGDAIVKKVLEIQKRGFPVNTSRNKNDDIYEIEGRNSALKAKINPERWLGVEVIFKDQSKKTISYSIDTDVYNISQRSQKEFAHKIGQDIVNQPPRCLPRG
jgi:hypothetical protein